MKPNQNDLDWQWGFGRILMVGLGMVLCFCSGVQSPAALSFNGSYDQNFDSLAKSPTSTDITWANDSTLPGWSLFNSSGAGITTYRATTSSDTTGSFYSFGNSSTSTERSLGSIVTQNTYFGNPNVGAVGGYIALALDNTSGISFDQIVISYSGEQWRDGGATSPAAQKLKFEFGFGNSFSTVASWTAPGSSFDFTSPVFANTGSGVVVNGNVAGKTSSLGGTVSGLTWNTGQTLWLRWVDINDVGSDHALSIDDFSISAASTISAVPEPSTYIAGALLLLPFGVHGIRYFRNRKHS